LKTLRVLVGDPDAERILGRDRYIDQRKRVEAEIRTDTS
jgi:hypothetical protein